MTTIKKLVTTNSGKDMEKLEPSFIHLVRMKDGTVTSENNLAAPQKFKHRIIIWPSNSTPRYIPPKTENKTQTLVYEYS